MAPRPVDVTIKGKDETKPAFDSASKTAKGFGSSLKDGILGPLSVVKAGIAGLVTGTIGMFAKASVESAAAADAAWGRVESAVRNVGMNFDLTRGSLDRLFTKIQQTTRYSDDDAADAFATLVRMSSDYTGSIRELSLVTDVAAAKKMDLASAAEVVGKVMAGETGHLKRLGVVVREGESAMEALRRQFAGFSERDARSLQGQLAQIANAWDNLKEAFGRALTSVNESGEATNIVVEALQAMSSWLDNNSDKVHDFFDWMFAPIRELYKTWKELQGIGDWLNEMAIKVGAMSPKAPTEEEAAAELKRFQEQHAKNVQARDEKLAQAERDRQARATAEAKAAEERAKKAAEAKEKHVAALKEEYALIQTMARLGGQTDKEKERALVRRIQLERELEAIARDKSQPMRARASAADFTADFAEQQRRALASFDPNARIPLAFTPQKAQTGPIPVRLGAAPMATPAMPDMPGFAQGVAEQFENAVGITEPLEASLGDLEKRLEGITGGALANFFTVWQDGIQDVIHEHNVLGRVVPQLMRKAVAASLQADAQDTMLRAAKALALALTDPSGIHFAQAGKLFAIGSAELAAAASLGGSGGSRGGAGGGAGLSSSGFQQSQSEMGGGRGKVFITLPRARGSYQADELENLRDAILELDRSRDIEFIYGD